MKVKHNQSLFDICIKAYGSIEPIFDLAAANNMQLTEVLYPGQEIAIPELETIDQDIVDYYYENEIEPATALSQLDNEAGSPGSQSCNYCKLFE